MDYRSARTHINRLLRVMGELRISEHPRWTVVDIEAVRAILDDRDERAHVRRFAQSGQQEDS